MDLKGDLVRVHISKTLYIFFDPKNQEGNRLQLIRDDGKGYRDFLWIEESESKNLRHALHSIETGDLTDEEKAS